VRTTVFIEDSLGERLREEAARRGMSMSAFLAEAGRRVLESPADDAESVKPFEIVAHGRKSDRRVLSAAELKAAMHEDEDRDYRPA